MHYLSKLIIFIFNSFIKVDLTFNKLCIFKVYNLMFQQVDTAWNHHRNQGYEHIQHPPEFPCAPALLSVVWTFTLRSNLLNLEGHSTVLLTICTVLYRSLDCVHLLLLLLLLSCFSRVWLCATPETAAHQAPPSLGFSRQEHWSGLPFPSLMHEREKWKGSLSAVSDSVPPHRQQPNWLPGPWDSPDKSTGVGCHFLL